MTNIELTDRDLDHIKQIHEQYRRLGWEYDYNEPPIATVSDALHANLRQLRELVVVAEKGGA